jgi:hypothetical protein
MTVFIQNSSKKLSYRTVYPSGTIYTDFDAPQLSLDNAFKFVQCGFRVQYGSVRVQCGSVGCSVAQLVARWLAVRQARVRISARHPMEVPPTEPTAEWMNDVWMYLLYKEK